MNISSVLNFISLVDNEFSDKANISTRFISSTQIPLIDGTHNNIIQVFLTTKCGQHIKTHQIIQRKNEWALKSKDSLETINSSETLFRIRNEIMEKLKTL
jgi:hypothetical protein